MNTLKMDSNLSNNHNLIDDNEDNLTNSTLNIFHNNHPNNLFNSQQGTIYNTSSPQAIFSSPLSSHCPKNNFSKQSCNLNFDHNENNNFHNLNSNTYSNLDNNTFIQPYNSCIQNNLQPVFDNTNLNQDSTSNANTINNNSSLSYSQSNYNSNSFSMLASNATTYDNSHEIINKQVNNFVKTQQAINNANSLHQYNISIHNTQECSSSLCNQVQTNSTNNLNTQSSNKKRKKDLTNSSKSKSNELLITLTHLNKHIKQEKKELKTIKQEFNSKNLYSMNPTSSINCDYYSSQLDSNEPTTSNYSSSISLDNFFQSIKFHPFQQNNWHALYDENFNEIATPRFEIYADKGFNYSNIDDVFVCQKKNHFQLTVHIHPLKLEDTHLNKQFKFNSSYLNENNVYIKVETGLNLDSKKYIKVEDFYLHFYGVKVESLNQIIRIEQSQSDRSKKLFNPIKVNILNNQIYKTTVGRLHFSETTANNMRKKGKPNPDQKYFYLIASLCVSADKMNYVIISYASERIIVRASNPGQFETDLESCWQKSNFASEAVYHNGKVGINTDDPEEALVVYGNLKLTGDLIQPSDYRIKNNLNKINTSKCLNNISKLNIYSFNYKNIYEKKYRSESLKQVEIGVLAQDVVQLMPNAVKNCGTLELDENIQIHNFLTIKKDHIFMEGLAAIQELNHLTKKIFERIENLEQVNTSNKSKNYLVLVARIQNITVFLFFILFISPFLRLTNHLKDILL